MNIASEVAQAIRGKPGWAGAAVAGRQRYGITLSHPTEPNRFFTASTIAPVHLADEVTEVDTDLVAATLAPWLYMTGPADYKFYVGPGTMDFDAGMPFRYEATTGESLQWQPAPNFTWINANEALDVIGSVQSVTGVVTGDTVAYSGAYGAGIDYEVRLTPGSVKKVLTLQASPPAPDPALLTQPTYLSLSVLFQRSSGITVWVDGIEWAEGQGVANAVTAVSTVEFRNSAGAVVFYLKRPYARDINSVLEGELRFRRQGGTYFIEMRFPYEWFLDPARVYPVWVDPTVNPQVGASDDDANETTAGLVGTGSNMRLNSSFPYFGMRLTAAVPNGATTNSAYAEIYGDHPSLTAFSCTDASFVAEDSCAVFDIGTAGSFDLSSRTSAGNGVAVAITLSTSAWTNTTDFTTASSPNSPDSVWSRVGWTSGNYVGIIFTHDGTGDNAQFKTYDEDTSLAPRLYVDYTSGGGGISIPVVMHHRRQTGQS